MSDYSTVQERIEFENKIFDQVQNSITNQDTYVNNIGLIINAKTLELNLATKEECSTSDDWYELNELIRNSEPDCDAIYKLASKYCFIE